MPMLPRVRSLWKTLFRADALDRELDDELRAAVETLARRHVADGMSPEAARRAALAALGALDGIRENVREARVGAAMDALLLDLRYAARGLAKARGLAAVIILTLALGIGANTAIFSVVHAMLIEPLPYRDADRAIFVWRDQTAMGYPRMPFSGIDMRAVRERSRTCDFGGIWATTVALTDGEPEQLRVGLVTTNFFEVLGADAALGRTFRPQDSVEGAEPAILLGWELFERRFGADPSIVGRRVLIDERPVTIVGVMPKSFRLLLPMDSSVPDHLQAWGPLWPDHEATLNMFIRVVGRLRPGASIVDAREELTAIAAQVSRERGPARGYTAVPLQTDDVREIRGPLLALFAGVGILLTIACVNVAGLLIARAASRAGETALRLALGASRGRLVRQSLAEGLLLTALGATAGMLCGYAALRMLIALTPASLSRLELSRIDGTVFAFALGISAVWGLVLSLAPLTELFPSRRFGPPSRLWRFGEAGCTPFSLRMGGGPTAMRYRTRAALVIVQIALSLVLLVGAGLLLRAFVAVLRVDPGFRADGQLTFRMAIPDRRYEGSDAFNTFARELQRRLAAIPGVTGAGAISHIPYDDLPNWGVRYSLQTPRPPDAPTTDARAISPGLFEMLGVRLIEGRFFTEDDDRSDSPVAIVDDKLARQLWPGRSAIGQRFYTQEKIPNTVVGVVRHLKLRSVVDELTPQIYLPWRVWQRNPIAWIVRTDRDPASLAPDIRAAVASIDRRVPIYDVRTMQTYVDNARSIRRFTMLLAAAFALTALALTAVGVYGVLAYAVAHRRHEFGVRRALGADTARVVGEVLREGMGFAAAGCAGGLAGALVAAHLLRTQLYAVHPRDPIAYGTALALVLAGAAVACWVPAYRAATISPMAALRGEG